MSVSLFILLVLLVLLAAGTVIMLVVSVMALWAVVEMGAVNRGARIRRVMNNVWQD